MAVLAGTVVAPALPASSLEPAWSVVAGGSPPGPPNGTFGSVACATETTCFALGNTIEGGVLFEQWNGADWSMVPPPETGVLLYDIACPSATSCFVVGFGRVANKDTPTIEHWDGTTWSVTANPEIPASAALESIACASPTSCVAVGRAGQTLIEQWDGATWSVVANPHPAKARSGYFVGVACTSATNCFAVGTSYDGTNTQPLIERWNGTAWLIVANPGPTSTTLPVLNSVACLGASSCFAIGSVQVYSAHSAITKALIEQWNGSKWSTVASPKVPGATDSSLADVSCPTTTTCFAVGSSGATLIERWNGSKWSVVGNPSALPTSGGLNGVACTSPTSCVAVGSGPTVTGPAIIERWNGTRWAVESHPMPMPPSSSLSGVSCDGATCFAVGQFTNSKGVTVTLVERPDASGWSLVPSPNAPGATNNGLGGVSCASATLCFAVGSSSAASSASKTLIERWNGSKWSVVASPNHGRDASDLASVSCTSSTSCFAVGSYKAGSSPKTLIERWNGSKWSIIPSPNRAPSAHVKTRSSRLESVSCATATSCFAVGYDANDTTGPFRLPTNTLVERWNGSTWSIVSSPNPGQNLNILHAVSCPSTNTCFAVGEFYTFGIGQLDSQSLVARWNGTAWTRVVNAGPNPASANPLNGISCSSPTSCFAVGNAYSSQWSTFVKMLAGASWSNMPSPNAEDGSSSHLQAVSCSSEARCYAVGYSGDHTALQHTLIESYA